MAAPPGFVLDANGVASPAWGAASLEAAPAAAARAPGAESGAGAWEAVGWVFWGTLVLAVVGGAAVWVWKGPLAGAATAWFISPIPPPPFSPI
jgi:hypothetical protein